MSVRLCLIRRPRVSLCFVLGCAVQLGFRPAIVGGLLESSTGLSMDAVAWHGFQLNKEMKNLIKNRYDTKKIS